MSAMEASVIVMQPELLELLAHYERRLAQTERRLDALEMEPAAEAAGEEEEELPVRITDVKKLVRAKRPRVKAAAAKYQLAGAADVEMETWESRRFLVEASHLMPHPDPEANDYKALSARDMPPMATPDEQAENTEYAEEEGCGEGSAEKTYTDLPRDTWGSGIICIIQELPKIFTGTAGYAQFLRTGFVLFCLIMNIVLQYVILWFVLEYVTNPAVAKLQILYKEYHATCFNSDGNLLREVWDSFSYRKSLCDVTLSEPAFISTMLLIWCTRMLGEFRGVLYLVRRIQDLPKVPHASLMINLRDTEAGVVHEIVGLTRPIQYTLHLLITLPKLGITIWLTFMGVRWLASTVSFPDLILNALGLQFIIEIDEMMLSSLYPERMIKALENAKFALPRVRLTVQQDATDLTLRYHQALIYMSMLFVFVYLYLRYFQQVLPHFEWDINSVTCASVRESQMPMCNGFRNPSCFPYGTNVSSRHLWGT